MKSVDEVSQQLIDQLSHDENVDTLIEQSASVAQPTTSKPTTTKSSSASVAQPRTSKATTTKSASAKVPIHDVNESESESEPEDEPKILVGSKRARTSIVWKDFDEKVIEGKVKAICHHCNKHLGGESKSGTKHLHQHLQRCPRKKLKDIRQEILKIGVENDGKTVLKSGAAFDQDECRLKLSKLIVMNELPFLITDSPAFRDYSSTLQPFFKMPCRTTARSDIMKLFKFEKAKLMKMFENNNSRIAITTDMWSSNTKKGFMVVTAHYIDDSWSLQSRIIRFVYVMSPHTANVLCEVLVETLMDWNIDHKLSTLTIDNCTTNDALINSILNKLSRKHLLLDGSLLHMRCCAHILNLIVKDGLKHISECLDKIRETVVYWNGGQKRLEKFEEVSRQLKIPYTKKLALDCPTRWNSTYLMLRSIIPYKDAFFRLHQRDSQYKHLPSNDEWKIAEEMCKRLHLFYLATEIFSGTKYPTTNLFFPKICDIKVALDQWKNCGDFYFESMAKNMIGKFDKYWDEIHGIMGIAIILDPRFKLQLLEYYYPILYGEEASKLRIERIKILCEDLIIEYANRTKEDKATLSLEACNSPSSDEDGWNGVPNPLDNFDTFLASRGQQRDKSAKSELDHYLEEALIPRTKSKSFDILAWWKQALKYPTLQTIARDILAIPISTVASESAFSTSGRVISDHRSNLKPDTIEALMCTHNWLWSQFKDTRMTTDVFAQYEQYLKDVDVDEVASIES